MRRSTVYRLVRDETGVTAVVIGLSMTALMGFAGLAVDAGSWYSDKRTAQGAVDSAAYSAAVDYATGDSATGVTAAAKAIAAQYGLTDGSRGVTVTVNQPPSSGSHTATAGAVEVIVHKAESLFLASLYMNSAAITARAVAVAGSGGGAIGPYCVLALDTTPATSVATAAFDITNGANLDLSACGVQVNATGPDSLVMSGGAKLTAKTVSVGGNYSITNGASMTVTGTTTTSAPSVADPYASVTMPTAGGCSQTNATYGGGGTFTISPGTYCNGLNIANGATVTMNPGVYVINGNDASGNGFDLQGGATVNATSGVTIVLTGSGSNYANMNIANGTTLNLTAPTSGATAGMAFFQDRNTPSSRTETFAGGSSAKIVGALYFPSQFVSFSNGSSNNGSCTQLIANRINYTGGSKFGNNCSGTGVKGIGAAATAPTLVE